MIYLINLTIHMVYRLTTVDWPLLATLTNRYILLRKLKKVSLLPKLLDLYVYHLQTIHVANLFKYLIFH